MAEVTKFKIPDRARPKHTSTATAFSVPITVASGDANSADFISLFVPEAGSKIVGAQMIVSATLGVSATAQLRLGTTAITGATTAGGADNELQTVAPAAANGTDSLNILIGGANITAGATITVSGFLLHDK